MENLKVVSNQVNWPTYDPLIEQIFSDVFGILLEKKVDEFEKTKKELKVQVKRIIEDPRVMPTPARKPKPAIALSKQIIEFKKVQSSANQHERDKRAQQIREEQLKERAERTKREREERALRVQKNNQVREAERKEQEEKMRVRLMTGTPGRTIATPKILNSAKKVVWEKPQFERDKMAQQMLEGQLKEMAQTTKREEQIQMTDEVVDMTQPEANLEVAEIREEQMQMTDEVVDMTQPEANLEVTEISAYDMTKEKIPIPSTEDNYNVDDLSSADETDPEDSPRKQIPKWAQKENLKQHVLALHSILPVENIEHYFGRIKQPTVQEFFNHTRKKYAKRRSSSATWDSPMSDPTPGFGRFQKMFQRS